jgi:hypothetical protein
VDERLCQTGDSKTIFMDSKHCLRVMTVFLFKFSLARINCSRQSTILYLKSVGKMQLEIYS